MRIRRRMRRMKRKSVVRRRRKITLSSLKRKQARKPEVKYFTYIKEDTPSKIAYSATANKKLYDHQYIFGNMFGGIVYGTGNDQRVGNKIYVKFIQFTMFTKACPGTTVFDIASYNLRMIVANTGLERYVAGTDISNFFGPALSNNFNNLVDRSRIYVKFDKTFNIPAFGSATISLAPYNTCGASKRLSVTVPIGKVIEYVNGTNSPKNDQDYLGLFLLVGLPGMNTVTNTQQVSCTDLIFRIYYTDV